MDSSLLQAFFCPRSVVVIGASRHRGTVGGELFFHLLRHSFPGALYPINEAASVVQSVKSYPSILEVPPGPIDLAIIAVPAASVLSVARECAQRGVQGLLVLSAGFSECGSEGKHLQEELTSWARAHEMRILGPNCLGLLNTDPLFSLHATFASCWPTQGTISIASQSGAVGLVLLDEAKNQHVGIHHFASLGNKADVSENDLLAYWENDPHTQAILLYLESFAEAGQFLQVARRVSAKKPIVAMKSGRTQAGMRAAASHTGALATMDAATSALLQQAGVVRVDTSQELFDVAKLLVKQPRPQGNRVAILTNAGGPGIMAADAAETQGLSLPSLSLRTIEKLRSFLPSSASVSNPIDMIASASASHYVQALQVLLEEENIDSVLVIFVSALSVQPLEIAQAVVQATREAKKPVLTCLLGKTNVAQAIEVLQETGLPTYSSAEAAMLALGRVLTYERWQKRPVQEAPVFLGINRESVGALLSHASSGWLPVDQVHALLQAYGIRLPHASIVTTAPAAVEVANRIGYPVALKIVSDTILHKTEMGGVVLNLLSAEEVYQAYESLERKMLNQGIRNQMQGVLVQEMVRGGVEMCIGVTQASNMGTLLAFGSGGTQVEIWKDLTFRVHPLTKTDVVEMMEQIRGFPLLQGFRGAPAADKDAVVESILRVNQMVKDFPEIQELDINPLCVLPQGQGVVALDARIRMAHL